MRRTMFVGVAAAFAVLGCIKDSEPIDRDRGELQDFARAYSEYQNAYGKPPESVAELVTQRANAGLTGLPAGIGRMKVPWGAGFGSLYREPDAANTVFASATPLNGVVPVLMADGTVKTMSQADFDKALKVAAPVVRRK